MVEESSSTERQRNIWAPWRMEYIDALSEGAKTCFLCRYRDEPENDAKNFVLWRNRRSFAMLNLFPYTSGHGMVAPMEHVGRLEGLDDETMLELMQGLRDFKNLLTHVVRAEGFNVGLNIGRCAGAGLPGHLHVHIVPRWSGDTNFMPVLGGVRVIPQSLAKLHSHMVRAIEELHLPR